MDEDETLELFDGSLVNNDGLEVYTASSEQLLPFELYSTSGAGWAELLKYTFQGLPQEGITDDDIIEERG
ncbi:MAG: hypothetical protein H6773_04495 [Pseudomonadales bacterium]|nr:hypothetical protein [Pseudomonadales bacterium]